LPITPQAGIRIWQDHHAGRTIQFRGVFHYYRSYLFRGASPPVILNEYVLDADGGTGHVEHADKAKAVSNVIVKKISLLM